MEFVKLSWLWTVTPWKWQHTNCYMVPCFSSHCSCVPL